ncbi:hypothetical protein [Eubacterium sp.]|uniref:hypothetical protein n=1 Tax=Eubacterium sp. TaxID=142586 RepID=UPI0039A3C81A
MKQPFENLTLEDVETLKRKPISVANAGDEVKYPFTQKDVENAVKHLQTLYIGIVRRSFASKILLLNEIY